MKNNKLAAWANILFYNPVPSPNINAPPSKPSYSGAGPGQNIIPAPDQNPFSDTLKKFQDKGFLPQQPITPDPNSTIGKSNQPPQSGFEGFKWWDPSTWLPHVFKQ